MDNERSIIGFVGRHFCRNSFFPPLIPLLTCYVVSRFGVAGALVCYETPGWSIYASPLLLL